MGVFPDAGIIGIQGSSSHVAAFLLSMAIVPIFGIQAMETISRVYDVLYEHTTVFVGVEILFSIASSQLAFFVYGGIGLTSSGGESIQVYSGLVWNLWNAYEYSGRGGYISSGVRKVGGSVFGSGKFISILRSGDAGGAFRNETWGVTFGRNIVGDYGNAIEGSMGGIMYGRVGDVIDFNMGGSVGLAILFSSLTSLWIAPKNPDAMLATTAIGSFWPYAKWSDSDKLANRQKPRS